MATVNRKVRNIAPKTHEGARAHRLSPEQQLRRSVLANLLWEDTFYEDGQLIADRIIRLVGEVPQEFVADLAVEARQEMYLRHVPLLLVREMAREGGPLVSETINKVVQRVDDMTELLALYWRGSKTPLSAQMKKGLAEAFTKFDAYQLAKYDRPDRIVRPRDVMFLTHPKPKDEDQAEMWKKLANDELDPPDTWEVRLSSGGDKREHWTNLLTERRLGGLALLRNLRNMTQAGVDEDLIARAIEAHPFPRVLPFRFISAARHAPDFEPVLEKAMLRAAQSLPKLGGRTALLVDHSASMKEKLSKKSTLNRFDAACGLAILLREICESVKIYAFSAPGAAAYYRRALGVRRPENDRPPFAKVPPRRGFALADALDQATPWFGTHTESGKKLPDRDGYDRLILITDEQSHQTISDPLEGARGYVVNVGSYKNGIGYGHWTHIDGWSEHVARYIVEAENAEVV